MALKTKLDTRNAPGFKFEQIGQSLQGYYIGTFDEVINGKDVKKHIFQTDIGLQSVLGQTHLTQLLAGIAPGAMTVSTFVGTKKTKQPQPMKLFELQYDDEDTIDPSGIVASAPAEEASEPEYADPAADGEDSCEEESTEEEAQEEPEPAPAPVKRTAAPAPKSAAPKAPVSRPSAGPISDAAKARAAALMPRK